MAAFATALLPVEEGVEPDEVPELEGDVAVAASEVETGVATESVAFLQLTLDGMVALSERVRSAHWGETFVRTLIERKDAFSYLVELTVATVEDELERDVGTVLDTADVGGREVDVDAERALTSGLEER